MSFTQKSRFRWRKPWPPCVTWPNENVRGACIHTDGQRWPRIDDLAAAETVHTSRVLHSSNDYYRRICFNDIFVVDYFYSLGFRSAREKLHRNSSHDTPLIDLHPPPLSSLFRRARACYKFVFHVRERSTTDDHHGLPDTAFPTADFVYAATAKGKQVRQSPTIIIYASALHQKITLFPITLPHAHTHTHVPAGCP